MKTKCFILLALITAFWGIWMFAYERGFTQGYSEGSTGEYYCWKQEPTTFNNSWDGKIIGRRDMNKMLGGKSVPQAILSPTIEWDKDTGKFVLKR